MEILNINKSNLSRMYSNDNIHLTLFKVKTTISPDLSKKRFPTNTFQFTNKSRTTLPCIICDKLSIFSLILLLPIVICFVVILTGILHSFENTNLALMGNFLITKGIPKFKENSKKNKPGIFNIAFLAVKGFIYEINITYL
jgi:hypothetical protein